MTVVDLDRLPEALATVVLEAMHREVQVLVVSPDQTRARIQHAIILASLPPESIARVRRGAGHLEVGLTSRSDIRCVTRHQTAQLRGRSLDYLVLHDLQMDNHLAQHAAPALVTRAGITVTL